MNMTNPPTKQDVASDAIAPFLPCICGAVVDQDECPYPRGLPDTGRQLFVVNCTNENCGWQALGWGADGARKAWNTRTPASAREAQGGEDVGAKWRWRSNTEDMATRWAPGKPKDAPNGWHIEIENTDWNRKSTPPAQPAPTTPQPAGDAFRAARIAYESVCPSGVNTRALEAAIDAYETARAIQAGKGDAAKHIKTLKAVGSVFAGIPAPCDERDAINAAIAALAGSQGEGVSRCPSCDDTGDVHGPNGEWRGRCYCPMAATTTDPVATDGDDASSLADCIESYIVPMQLAGGLDNAVKMVRRAATYLRLVGTPWFCEEHPDQPMGHDGCKGAGVLLDAVVPLFANQVRLLNQRVNELTATYGFLAEAALTSQRQIDAVAEVVTNYEIKDGIGTVIAALTYMPVGTKLYTAPPTAIPDGMVVAKPKCPNCDSSELSWAPHLLNNSGVVDGRLRMHDVSCSFVLGCDECSETVRVIDADAAARLIAAAPGSAEGE